MPIAVQEPPPAGLRSKRTESTPEPPVSAEFEETEIVPRTAAPSAGAVSEPVGFVLSTVTVRSADVKLFPASSVVTARRS